MIKQTSVDKYDIELTLGKLFIYIYAYRNTIFWRVFLQLCNKKHKPWHKLSVPTIFYIHWEFNAYNTYNHFPAADFSSFSLLEKCKKQDKETNCNRASLTVSGIFWKCCILWTFYLTFSANIHMNIRKAQFEHKTSVYLRSRISAQWNGVPKE